MADPAVQRSGIQSDGRYLLSASDIERFHEDGFLLLPGVLTEEEMRTEIDSVYHRYMQREIHVPGKDLCDMSGSSESDPASFQVYNVMLPRIYYPPWQGNVYERRCQDIANQLRDGDMVLDFDQIFAKRPESSASSFAWHQDCAYWPPLESDTAAVNCWLAVSDVTLDNGCLRYVPSSHKDGVTRRHYPVGKTRAESHAIYTPVDESQERVVDVPAPRGSVIVHHEGTVHASRPNLSDSWRHAYILNFRKAACVEEERRLGFDHSHNSAVNWDVFSKWEK